MIAYPAMLDVPTELAEFLAGLLAAERVNRGTPDRQQGAELHRSGRVRAGVVPGEP